MRLAKLISRCLVRHAITTRLLSSSLVRSNATEDPVDSDTESRSENVLHTPVMLREVIQYLEPSDNQVFIDMTFGSGGHTRQILKSGKNIRVYGVDRDPVAHNIAQLIASKQFPEQLVAILGRFSEVPTLLEKLNVAEESVDGVLIDAGCSSMQFEEPHRGFSVSKNGPLDMRMDGIRFPSMATAADAVNTLNAAQLAKIFKVYGEEKHAKKIAQVIFDARFMMKSVNTTKDLADLVAIALNTNVREDQLNRKVHSATKVFQALRIFVNNELNELNYAMQVAHRFLRPGGHLVALTFHSLEDRIVKRHITGVDMDEPSLGSVTLQYRNPSKTYTSFEMQTMCSKKWHSLTKGVVLPSEDEVYCNPRSRSAKLRAALKI